MYFNLSYNAKILNSSILPFKDLQSQRIKDFSSENEEINKWQSHFFKNSIIENEEINRVIDFESLKS